MTLDLNTAREAAEQAADAAEAVIQKHLDQGQWSVSLKADDSPVTEVDIAAEQAISDVLRSALPAADFYGEETGRQGSQASVNADSQPHVLWLVDPIDGTKSFIRNMPYYSTQIALMVDNTLSVGVSNAPAYGQRLVAVAGQGVWLNGQPVQTRQSVTSLEQAYLSSGNLSTLAQDAAAWQRYGRIVAGARRVRGYGDFCHYHQLCCGQADLVIESDVNILDIAALCVAVRAAGGIMTDLSGHPITESTTSVLAAGTRALHEQVLHTLQQG